MLQLRRLRAHQGRLPQHLSVDDQPEVQNEKEEECPEFFHLDEEEEQQLQQNRIWHSGFEVGRRTRSTRSRRTPSVRPVRTRMIMSSTAHAMRPSVNMI